MDEQTAPLSIRFAALVPDLRNARRHSARNLATIASALREVGAARSAGDASCTPFDGVGG